MSEQIAKIREKSTLGRPWVDLLTPWGAMSLPKSIKLEPGGVLGHLERLWAARLGSRSEKPVRGTSPFCVFMAQNGRPRVDFGPLAVHGGIQNLTFWSKISIKSQKSCSRRGSR